MGPQGKKAPAPVPTIPLPDLKHCIQLRRNEARDGRQLHMDSGEDGQKTAERPSVYIRSLGEEVKVRLCFVIYHARCNLVLANW